jgi:hypothetical protein
VWSAHVMESASGTGAEESTTGADLLVHARLNTPELKYSKGVLIQSKRIEPNKNMTSADHRDLIEQCKKMLRITQAAFVLDYTTTTVRCGSASVIRQSPIEISINSVHGLLTDFF